LKHKSYNTLPPHIQQVQNSELLHLKKAIVKELQEQVFSLHCSENAFVGIFKTHITRYSPCGSFYCCSFKGETAFNEIGKLLDDKNWGSVIMVKGN
jgi:hypothetical protein